MCDTKDAQRHEKLAQLYEKENNLAKAIEHYLEASTIYILNAQLLKDGTLIEKANLSYAKSQSLRGKKEYKKYSIQELAKRTLEELNQIQTKKNPAQIMAKIKGII